MNIEWKRGHYILRDTNGNVICSMDGYKEEENTDFIIQRSEKKGNENTSRKMKGKVKHYDENL